MIYIKTEKKKTNMRINQIEMHFVRGQPCTWDLRLIITPGVKAVNTTPQGKQALEVHRN